MKAITLTQPYATLIAIGAKRIETRGWPTSYRGPLAIHAGKGLGPIHGISGLIDLLMTEPFRSTLAQHEYMFTADFPRGAIVAVCELMDCRPIPHDLPLSFGYATEERGYTWNLTDRERAFGDYTPGRFAWLLDGVRALPEPIPARGALSLWDWTPLEDFTL